MKPLTEGVMRNTKKGAGNSSVKPNVPPPPPPPMRRLHNHKLVKDDTQGDNNNKVPHLVKSIIAGTGVGLVGLGFISFLSIVSEVTVNMLWWSIIIGIFITWLYFEET